MVDDTIYQLCKNVQPDTWEWILRGCWIFQPSSLWPAVLPAALLGVMLLSLRQVQGR